jgi:hypothetical protein
MQSNKIRYLVFRGIKRSRQKRTKRFESRKTVSEVSFGFAGSISDLVVIFI